MVERAHHDTQGLLLWEMVRFKSKRYWRGEHIFFRFQFCPWSTGDSSQLPYQFARPEFIPGFIPELMPGFHPVRDSSWGLSRNFSWHFFQRIPQYFSWSSIQDFSWRFSRDYFLSFSRSFFDIFCRDDSWRFFEKFQFFIGVCPAISPNVSSGVSLGLILMFWEKVSEESNSKSISEKAHCK